MRRTTFFCDMNPLVMFLTSLYLSGTVTEARAAAGHSHSLLADLVSSEYHPRHVRQISSSLTANPSSGAAMQNNAVYPSNYPSSGISRTLYPSYMGYPVYSSPSGVGYTVPKGATPVQQFARSYSPSYRPNGATYGSYNYPSSYSNSYSPSPVTNTQVNLYSPALVSRSLYPQPVASARANTPYGYSNNYYTPSRNTMGNYALSYRSADVDEPEDPASDSSGTMRRGFISNQAMTPNFPQASVRSAVQPVANADSFTVMARQMSSLPAGQLAAFSGRGMGGGSTSGYGVGNTYASAVPDGATQAQYGGQTSPNTVSGSLYNPNYANPTFYGKSPSYGGGGSGPISPALSYPLFMYFPVSYGYDQGEQSVMPTGGYFPLIGYKRRYGYRNGPYYGYGIYVDYPPYFGFGKVKDGFGSDPEADLMASVALEQGSGASESLNSQAGTQSGYGQPGSSGYGGKSGTAGYPTTGGSYGTPAASASGYAPTVSGYNSPPAAAASPSAYGNMGGSTYSSPSYQQTDSQYPSQRSLSMSSLPSGYVPAASSQPVTRQTSQYGSSLYSAASRSYSPSVSSVSSLPAGYASYAQNAASYRMPANSASNYGTPLSTSG